MLWTSRPDGAVEFLNARVLQYTGMSAARLKDRGWKPVLHPDDLAGYDQRRKRALLTGKGFEAEYRLRRADGRVVRLPVVKFPLPDESGGLGVAAIGFDIMALGAEKQTPSGPEPENRLQRLRGRERQVLQLTVLGCTSAKSASASACRRRASTPTAAG